MRSLVFFATVAVALIGCVSISQPIASVPSLPPRTQAAATPAPPTPSTTDEPTAEPTDEPTQEPTAEPTSAEPTDEPTEEPTDEPALTPAPSLGVIEDFGADTLLFADDFSNTASGWGVGDNAGGTVAYADGALQFDTVAAGSWMWSRRAVDSLNNVVHIEADLMPSAPGYQGLLCADSDDELWGAVADSTGLWVFIKLDSSGSTILSSGPEEGFALAPGTTTRLALDCQGTQAGSFRMQLSLPDSGLAAVYEGQPDEGAPSFDRAGIYAESAEQPYSMRADNLFVYGGTGETTQMSDAAEALLTHVPAEWQSLCFESVGNPFDEGITAAVSCTLEDGRSEVIDYLQFDTTANMITTYDQRVDIYSVEATGSCQTGPNETSYTIGGAPAGRVLCAPSVVGIRVDWTHDALAILSTLTDFEGSYPDAYQDWLIAGPN
jgi:hypothetical protein